MSLSTDLISQFVKATKDDKQVKGETTIYGTAVEHEGRIYAKLDGSELLTPVAITTNVTSDDRVLVQIKHHTATIIGNLTSPSARIEDLNNMGSKITEFEIMAAYRVTTTDLEAVNAIIDNLKAKVAQFNNMTAVMVEIEELKATYAALGRVTANEVTALNASIESIKAMFGDFADLSAEDLDAMNADIDNLKAYNANFTYVSADVLSALRAYVKQLDAEKLSAVEFDAKYADIDFSNITQAAIEHFYSTSGLIKNVTVGDQTITGELVGVTIKGDLIEAETLVADKLVMKGEDGLYYKLNTDGVVTEAEQTDYNSLDGQVIRAKSITATKVDVSDLVAFNATIGGFHITDKSLYSGVKESVDNSTRGIYLDSEGQMAVGDSSNFIRYYRDENGNYKLAISAESIIFAASNKAVEAVIDGIDDQVNEVKTELGELSYNALALIAQLSDSISMLVTDGNGTSLMTQTDDGWTFSTADIMTAVNDTSQGLNDLTKELGDTNSAVNVLQQTVSDLGTIADYVKINTYEDEPCIELGEGDSDFKLRITNTRMIFTEGSEVLAYFNNQSLHIKKAVVEEELQQGGFVWKIRSNGNLGLIWKGGNN